MMSDRKLTPEQQQLASAFFPLAVSMAKRSGQMSPELEEEMISHCTDILCRAAMRFRPGKASFFTFARHRLRGAITDRIRDIAYLTRHGNRRILEVPFDFGGDRQSMISGIDPGFDRVDVHDACEFLIGFLNERETAVIRSKYQRGTGLRGGSEKLELSGPTCSLIHSTAIAKLRERFKDERKIA